MAKGTFKHSFKSINTENLGLQVYSTGYQKCESGYFWGPGIRPHFLIHGIIKGKGQFFCNHKTYSLVSGDLFIIFPSQLASYKADVEEPWEYCWVGFQGTEAKRLVNMTMLSEEEPVIHVSDNDRVLKQLYKIYKSRGNAHINDMRMVGYFYLFLSELISLSKHEKPLETIRSEYIEQALRYVAFNYTYPISIDDIAEYTGVSRSHLYRIFIQHTGYSPNDYLQRYRINQACSLIRKGDFSMGEIANSVGFTDPLYFSRVFKKIKGIPPTKYLETRHF